MPKFLSNIDLSKLELQNACMHKLTTAPINPRVGLVYHNTVDEAPYICVATEPAVVWKNMLAANVEASATNGNIKIDGTEVTVYSLENHALRHQGDGTDAIADATTSIAGLMPAADKTALDGATDASTAGAIIKRDSNGRARVAAPSHDDDIANKGYVTASFKANDAMIYKGMINASGPTHPNYPAADAGHTYKISHAGKIGGADGPNVEIGDMIVCKSDDTAAGTHAAVGASWNIIQANIDGAVTGPVSATTGNFPAFTGDSGRTVVDSGKGPASFVDAADVHNAVITGAAKTVMIANKGQSNPNKFSAAFENLGTPTGELGAGVRFNVDRGEEENTILTIKQDGDLLTHNSNIAHAKIDAGENYSSPRKRIMQIGETGAEPIGQKTWTLTHGFGTKDLSVSIRDTTTDELVYADVKMTSNDQLQIIMVLTATTVEFNVTIIG